METKKRYEEDVKNLQDYKRIMGKYGIDLNKENIQIVSVGKTHIYFKKYKGQIPPLYKQYGRDFEAVTCSYLRDRKPKFAVGIFTNKKEKTDLPFNGMITTDEVSNLSEAWEIACSSIGIKKE